VATPIRRIVDSSPLILLAKAGQLDVLRAGVAEVRVPDAVLSEVRTDLLILYFAKFKILLG
jgi:hypothetical protein